MLNIKNKVEGTKTTISLEGRLDTTTAPQFEQEVKNALAGVTELVLDLEKLDYVSSAGLRVFLSVQKLMKSQGTMKVTHVNEDVYEIFEVTGFSEILTIE